MPGTASTGENRGSGSSMSKKGIMCYSRFLAPLCCLFEGIQGACFSEISSITEQGLAVMKCHLFQLRAAAALNVYSGDRNQRRRVPVFAL